MGLFDFIKNELIDVIDWVEKDNDTVLWKFPDKDYNIKNGAKLTVRESQTAMLVDEGRMADIFEPGMYSLHTENIPILTTLRSWKHGFNSPYKVDVYYVSTKQFTDLRWGTPNPIILRDPQFKQVRVKAFGTYFIRISDAALFFKEFAGTAPILKIGSIEDRLRDIVSPKFSEALAESGVSVLDMVSNYTELGERILPTIQKDLEPFGIELTKFQITSTSLPKEVEEFYDKMTNMNMVDDMDKFQKFQQANALEDAAKNPNGGASDGVGMGLGLGLANQMMQNQNQNQNQNQGQSKEDIMKTLKDLGELKESGILTQEEFDAKKKDLLARL